MTEQTAKRLTISGRVQGVGFRASTQQKARALGVHGWVRNRADGRVEAKVWGAPEAVQEMVEWCRRGPSYARVDDVLVEDTQPDDERGFRVRY